MKLKRLSYVVFLIGLSVFMFPHVSKVFFTTSNQIAFNEYEDTVSVMSESEINKKIEEIRLYNESLMNNVETVILPLEVEEVESLDNEPADKSNESTTPVVRETKYIDPFIGGVKTKKSPIKTVTKAGAFGYLKIPRINETLTIYLGATKEHLAKGVGQIEETSLPIGGLGTNSVLAGHRGYYRGANIFKHLDKIVVGDKFYIHVYDEILTYMVTGTEVILPNQTEKLNIDPAKDQVTLLTCTPFRVNTHRLLIYAERVSQEQSSKNNESIIVGHNGNTISGVLNESADRSNSVNSTVKSDQMISYAVVVIGGVLWVLTFTLLIKSFFKPKKIKNSNVMK